jgi:adenine-specific DNA-methyltransferase
MAKKKTVNKTEDVRVEAYSHKGEKRKNIPPVGLVSTTTDKLNGKTKYEHDPYIDPFLSWSSKKEGMSFEIQNLSLHIHERIDPSRIVKSFLNPKKDEQLSLFDQSQNSPPLNKAVDFYHHEQDWTNRLIAGDSLLVMNSLLVKEGMAGKVQMMYFDPPYGIKYNSNFQPFLGKKDVKDGNDDDIPAEPEMIQAFRDTWELGIHSYLTHLRDRLLLTRELLNQSGSVFIQISDENVHFVRMICDEVFGKENFISQIVFRKKTMPLGAKFLEQMADIIVWYSKDKQAVKFKNLYKYYEVSGLQDWKWVELPDGKRREMTETEIFNDKLLPEGSRIYRLKHPSPIGNDENKKFDVVFEGETFKAPANGWGVDEEKMQNLIKARRVQRKGNILNYIIYHEDSSYTKITNPWYDTVGPQDKLYVVQTNNDVIQRCMLMTTDPGDLVLDITCGSGTTANVAEEWGRRWITCDTSRVAITLAKQRMMTSRFEYFKLAYPEQGVKSGFIYKMIPHVTLGSIANNEPAKQDTLYDKPVIEKDKIRVTGPFTVEAVPSLRIKPFDGNLPKLELNGAEFSRTGETGKQSEWRDELKSTGIRAIGGKLINFSTVEPMLATRFLHARAEVLEKDGTNRIAFISFGPDFGPLEQRQAEAAITEARALKEKPDFIIFAAFHFDPEAAKDIDQMEWKGVTILKAQMSVDLLTADLRKKRSSNQSYWLIGQPDIEIKKKGMKYIVKLHGFDYYNPITGEIESKGTKHIAMWFLDTDYDERSIMPDQVFFPENDGKRDWTKLAKALKSDLNETALEKFSGVESMPFTVGTHKRIAVKIIDSRGIESFVIKRID